MSFLHRLGRLLLEEMTVWPKCQAPYRITLHPGEGLRFLNLRLFLSSNPLQRHAAAHCLVGKGLQNICEVTV